MNECMCCEQLLAPGLDEDLGLCRNCFLFLRAQMAELDVQEMEVSLQEI